MRRQVVDCRDEAVLISGDIEYGNGASRSASRHEINSLAKRRLDIGRRVPGDVYKRQTKAAMVMDMFEQRMVSRLPPVQDPSAAVSYTHLAKFRCHVNGD